MSESEEEKRTCAVVGCSEEAAKVVGRTFVPAIQALKLRLKGRSAREIPLCKKHYKMVKEAMEALRSR